MRANKKSKALFSKLTQLTFMGVLMISASSCVKSRPATLPDGAGDDIYEKGLFESASISVKTGSTPLLANAVSSGDSSAQALVSSVDAPDKIQPMFRELPLSAKPSSSVGMRFKMDKESVTAYRIADDASSIPARESQLAKVENGKILVPVFQYKVKAFGTLVRVKNDLGVETAALRLKPSEWQDATHIQVSTLTADRLMVAFPVGAGDEVYEKAAFTGAKISAQTGDALAKADTLLEADETAATKVLSVTAPDRIKPVFEDLTLSAKPKSSAQIRFEIDKENLTGLLVVEDASRLSLQEQQLTKVSDSGETLLPVFQTKVKGYGILERTKTDAGLETAALKLRPTTFEVATHITVSMLKSDRVRVGLAAAAKDVAETVFVRSKIENAIFTKNELEKKLNISVAGSSDTVFYTTMETDTMKLFKVTSSDDSHLNADQLAVVASQDQGKDKSKSIMRCSADVLAKAIAAGIKTDAKSCVILIQATVPIAFVKAARKAGEVDGVFGSEVSYEAATVSEAPVLVRIAKAPPVTEFESNPRLPERILSINAVKGREFFMRRTLKDTPNAFEYTFAGSAGGLEIVRFEFEKSSVKVVRADARLPVLGANDNDRETLLSFPASYYLPVKVDATGAPIDYVRYLDATESTPGAVAYVNFSVNEVPNVSSPLEYYGIEQCFRGVTDRRAVEIEQRTENNLFNLGFTQRTTYSSSPEMGCSDIFSSNGQASLVFEERISFQEYAHNGTKDETPMRPIPFDAQKKLGFGLFTNERLTPDKFGNTDKDGTRTSLAEIFDIQNGKQITYVLAGIPTEEPVRTAIINATRDVIADVNTAYRKALAGTTLERKEDVVVLRIEGEDIDTRTLGDLGRNYIYFIPKQTASTIIGLGGAHANPRTGKVVSASVFIYGGNIFSYVDTMKKRAKVEKEYDQLVASKTVAAPAAPAAPSTGGSPKGAKPSGAAQISSVVSRENVSNLASMAEKLKDVRSGSALDFSTALSAVIKNPSKAESLGFSVLKGFDEARKLGVVANERQVTGLVNEALAKSFKALAPEAARQKAMSKVMDRLEKAHYCAFDVSQITTSPKAVDEMSDLDAAMAIYRPTLAHEIGHNLGLRHNFIGSFDKENFTFSPKEESIRTYSSIMDYLVDDAETYDGMGPQDVSALRAAYSGLLELSPDAAKAAASAKPAVSLVSGKYISLEDYRSLLGLKSWLNLTPGAMEKAPLKSYMFCTDEDAGEYPTCNRFDKGTTPGEIVDFHIHQYKSLYALRNFAGDRLDYTYWRSGGYVGGIFGTFTPIRQFMEETLFQLIHGADQATINSYLDAAVKGLFFFQSVVRTPDAPASINPNDRFVTLTAKDNSQILVERKWLKDLSSDSYSDRIDVRGIEFDKMIALILLTERNMGFARYERESLRISFPQLEQMLIGKDEDPLSYPTIGLLNELFSDSVAAGTLVNGKLQQLPAGQFKVETSEAMRMYAVLGAMLSLDVSGLESSANLSALFRIKSAEVAPKGITAIIEPGLSSKKNVTDSRLFAMDSAVAAKALVDQAYAGQVVIENNVLVTNLSKHILENIVAGASKKALTAQALAKQKQKDRAFDLQLAKLPEAVGPRKVAEIQDTVEQAIVLVGQLEAAIGKVSDAALAAQAKKITDLMENVAKGSPILGSVLETIKGEELGMTLYDKVKPDGVVESARGLIFSNAKTLNELFYMSHPEAAK